MTDEQPEAHPHGYEPTPTPKARDDSFWLVVILALFSLFAVVMLFAR